MKIARIAISNYKSCKYVQMEPDNLSVIIGRNAAGKSNFVDSLDFLGHVYRSGLENAVAIKGGYENIAFRRVRRARSEIGFSVCAQMYAPNLRAAGMPYVGYKPESRRKGGVQISFKHDFAFRAQGREISADFYVTREQIVVAAKEADAVSTVSIIRTEDNKIRFEGDVDSELAKNFAYFLEYSSSMDLRRERKIAETELMLSLPFMTGRILNRFVRFFRNIAVFQVSPELARTPGVPSPNPALARNGQNLPAVISWLKKRAPSQWKLISQAMHDIAPEIERIDVDYLHTKTLGLYFHEQGVPRPWTVEDMSDGTVRALAMLVSCFDPRTSLLIIEEPENSVHPWVIQNLIKSLRDISVQRDVIITSHSPSVINSVSPDEVWVAYKAGGATQVVHLPVLDPTVLQDWSEGAYKLFDYIESGLLPHAVPGGVA